MVVPFALQGIALSQDGPRLVDTGVIFSAQQVERSGSMGKSFDGVRPLWTPSAEEITRLESKLRPYLEDVSNGKRTEGADYWARALSGQGNSRPTWELQAAVFRRHFRRQEMDNREQLLRSALETQRLLARQHGLRK
jgi:hypothetical protein